MTDERLTNTTDFRADNQLFSNGLHVDTDIPTVNEQPSGISDRFLDGGITGVGNGGTDKQLKPSLTEGTYRHFRGNIYDVLGLARHTETGEWIVVYSDLSFLHLWARPYESFMEQVVVDGRSVPRFQLLCIDELMELQS